MAHQSSVIPLLRRRPSSSSFPEMSSSDDHDDVNPPSPDHHLDPVITIADSCPSSSEQQPPPSEPHTESSPPPPIQITPGFLEPLFTDVLMHIFSFLPERDLFRLAHSSRRLRDISSRNALWEPLFFRTRHLERFGKILEEAKEVQERTAKLHAEYVVAHPGTVDSFEDALGDLDVDWGRCSRACERMGFGLWGSAAIDLRKSRADDEEGGNSTDDSVAVPEPEEGAFREACWRRDYVLRRLVRLSSVVVYGKPPPLVARSDTETEEEEGEENEEQETQKMQTEEVSEVAPAPPFNDPRYLLLDEFGETEETKQQFLRTEKLVRKCNTAWALIVPLILLFIIGLAVGTLIASGITYNPTAKLVLRIIGFVLGLSTLLLCGATFVSWAIINDGCYLMLRKSFLRRVFGLISEIPEPLLTGNATVAQFGGPPHSPRADLMMPRDTLRYHTLILARFTYIALAAPSFIAVVLMIAVVPFAIAMVCLWGLIGIYAVVPVWVMFAVVVLLLFAYWGLLFRTDSVRQVVYRFSPKTTYWVWLIIAPAWWLVACIGLTIAISVDKSRYVAAGIVYAVVTSLCAILFIILLIVVIGISVCVFHPNLCLKCDGRACNSAPYGIFLQSAFGCVVLMPLLFCMCLGATLGFFLGGLSNLAWVGAVFGLPVVGCVGIGIVVLALLYGPGKLLGQLHDPA